VALCLAASARRRAPSPTARSSKCRAPQTPTRRPHARPASWGPIKSDPDMRGWGALAPRPQAAPSASVGDFATVGHFPPARHQRRRRTAIGALRLIFEAIGCGAAGPAPITMMVPSGRAGQGVLLWPVCSFRASPSAAPERRGLSGDWSLQEHCASAPDALADTDSSLDKCCLPAVCRRGRSGLVVFHHDCRRCRAHCLAASRRCLLSIVNKTV